MPPNKDCAACAGHVPRHGLFGGVPQPLKGERHGTAVRGTRQELAARGTRHTHRRAARHAATRGTAHLPAIETRCL
jgi:hypothetical protein